MIIRSVSELKDTERHASGTGWESTRLLMAHDKMGFSLHETIVHEGQELTLQYHHHLEANFCIEGQGEVVEVASGKTHPLKPGSLYALNHHDAHIVRATHGSLRLVCVFNPALNGREKHVNGGYEPTVADDQA
ncbi:ectoine synthase [Acetobacter sp.]|uniref:ectoine synthase n=1 Tax=Acetobacter sp. TaxID=440 RepID=UPI0039EBFCBA